jgi:hypothetical protein
MRTSLMSGENASCFSHFQQKLLMLSSYRGTLNNTTYGISDTQQASGYNRGGEVVDRILLDISLESERINIIS